MPKGEKDMVTTKANKHELAAPPAQTGPQGFFAI